MSLEQVVILAIFVLVAIFNFVRQILAQRRQGRRPAEAPDEEPPPSRPPAAPPRVIVVPPPPVEPPAPPRPRRAAPPLREGPAPRPVARPRPRRRARRLFATRGDARRGIVLLTVLGPCRGLESPAEPTGDIQTPQLPR